MKTEDKYPNLYDFLTAPFAPMRPVELSAESLRDVQKEGLLALDEIEELRARVRALSGGDL